MGTLGRACPQCGGAGPLLDWNSAEGKRPPSLMGIVTDLVAQSPKQNQVFFLKINLVIIRDDTESPSSKIKQSKLVSGESFALTSASGTKLSAVLKSFLHAWTSSFRTFWALLSLFFLFYRKGGIVCKLF